MRNLNLKRCMASITAAALLSASAIGSLALGGNNIYLPDVCGNLLIADAASSISIVAGKGYENGAYVTWTGGSGSYDVYCDGVKIDSQLIRKYSDAYRADIVGLKAGSHSIKVAESGQTDGVTASVTSTSYLREGFCFAKSSVTGGSGIGAYNDDGTLKSGAVVLYVSESTKNTVKMSVETASGKYTDCTGISEILKAMQKGAEKRPVAIRIIGKVTASGMTGSGDTNNLLLKASSTSSPIQNVTVEGIGEDATCYGFGVRCQRARSIEIRNLGVMLFGDDGIALETDNYNIWVHNNDIFYGTAGSDADQAKGDGSMDLKNDSKYITVSANHFWDSGKMSLCGMKSETGENFITYHHNWFDHSDSRHPRIRTMSVHVYNNYYDGVAKYGVGVTCGGSAFVENNYFRNCPKPMMSSKQGTDALGEGTFSGENGGVIKAYNNYMEGVQSYITYAQDSKSFDAYEVKSPTEKVPDSVTALAGGSKYTNFDTSSSMYSYKADDAKDVAKIVTAMAGRVGGGDFKFAFNNAVDDTSYAINSALMSAVKSYSGNSKSVSGTSGYIPPETSTTTAPSVTTAPVQTTTKPTTAPTVTPTVSGGFAHNFTTDGTSSSFYSITGNLSTSKGTASYNGMTLTQCLKLESATNISFTAGSAGKLTLVFGEAAGTVKIDGTKYTASNGIVSADLSAGSHTITKADTANLFYMNFGGSGSSSVVTTTAPKTTAQPTVTTTKNNTPSNVTLSDVKATCAGGWNEMLFMELSGIKASDITGVSYSGASSGTLTDNDLAFLVRDISSGVRIDIPGLKAGKYSVTLQTSKGRLTKTDIEVAAQDRSGYAHYNFTEGVGAYNDDGTLKANAKVLYVTEQNKNSVTITSKDGTTVKGIGNILNSAGQDIGGGKTSNGGTKPNSNSGIIKKLAEDGTPLVIRIIGNVTAPDGLTAYDSTDFGGSVGDNGFMARMKSGKDVTIEGIGTDACVNGWGFHFMAEIGAKDFGKSFEVRNIKFKNVPEDCVGMEGVQEGSDLTAPVERCWIHNCEFYKPSISNPAESDKSGGDGACDFKRGMYFTNSYCYYEGYHKTNLVGASDSNLQYHLTYHHNYWKNCESRGPLARQANIHMYDNIFSGQTSYCMNPRADAYIFSEYNVFENCKNPMQVKQGAIKSYKDVLTGCKGDMDGTVVSSKDAKVSCNNKYANFDTNSSICYIPSGDYLLHTDTSQLSSIFEKDGGTMDAMTIGAGALIIDSQTPATTPTTTPQQTDNVTYGDANCDNKIDIADVVLLKSWLLNSQKYSVSAQGLKNADVQGNGNGINNNDVVAIQKFALKMIDSLPV